MLDYYSYSNRTVTLLLSYSNAIYSQLELQTHINPIHVDEEGYFGQEQVPLTDEIREILEEYPDGQIFKVCIYVHIVVVDITQLL